MVKQSATAEETALPVSRGQALSPALLARIFYQASLVHFNAVAEHLSVREASRRLNIAASAVSRQISQLEFALGVELFVRDRRRRLTLSPAGEILYGHTRNLGNILDSAVDELELLRGLKTGTVRIATVESIGIAFLPEIISEFGRRYPGLQLEVSMVPGAEVIERLIDERAEVGFGFPTDTHPQIAVALHRDVHIGAMIRHDHPLADSRGPVSLAECLAHPMAIANSEISIRRIVDPFLLQATQTLPPMVEVDSIRMLVELALTGRYVSITTPIGAQTDIAEGRLVFRPLSEEGLPANRFGVMLRGGGTLPLAAAVFLDYARNQFLRIELPGAVLPEGDEG
ncbi:LysR family transcriptional regulator [Paracoccus aminovorans]|uniref:LysR family transcriptional regulator n=1 Tax=Paracoccus aminovorans TaxID=34004 RepID=UPI000783CBF7|nr:LysR family transcriptional regulator [Paracoccus aminovorans]MDQ7774385.1 LysR family transcriptional regulator [Paracoccus aminovorans]